MACDIEKPSATGTKSNTDSGIFLLFIVFSI
jgi:hypothetical protein